MLIRAHKKLAHVMLRAYGPFSHEELDRKAELRYLAEKARKSRERKKKKRKRKKKSSVNKELLRIAGATRTVRWGQKLSY